ncbi:NUDIX hydrolase [Propionicicella superfundia]|uniref:NUDIX hydrolase n=1 Tax=Propionicicella superfundia TaxID=348582 RepID=UPI0004152648|nr:8-oxo-dGTP diphosphatase [Propionicicella superfundia]
MPFTPVIGVLAYILSPSRDEVLLVHRIARPGDAHFGKYNGLGGKLEPGEDVVSGLRRELREEASIEATGVRLRGTVSWPGFGAGGEDWLGFVFVVDAFSGVVPDRNEEGPLTWVPLARLADLPMWEGDRHFLPLVFDDAVGQFHGVLPYEDGRPVSWDVTILP